MKIIGHVGDNGYIASLTRWELENIAGKSLAGTYGQIPIATEVPVNERFRRIWDLEQREEEAKKAAAAFRAYADLLEGPFAKVKFPPEEPKAVEQKAEG